MNIIMETMQSLWIFKSMKTKGGINMSGAKLRFQRFAAYILFIAESGEELKKSFRTP